MKAQTHSNSRGRKDFICREEKRKTAYWEMQGGLETGDPIAFFFVYCLRAEMPFRGRLAFPREEKYLLNLLWSVLYSDIGISRAKTASPFPSPFRC
jgi:hypothetical protein